MHSGHSAVFLSISEPSLICPTLRAEGRPPWPPRPPPEAWSVARREARKPSQPEAKPSLSPWTLAVGAGGLPAAFEPLVPVQGNGMTSAMWVEAAVSCCWRVGGGLAQPGTHHHTGKQASLPRQLQPHSPHLAPLTLIHSKQWTQTHRHAGWKRTLQVRHCRRGSAPLPDTATTE